MHNYNPKLWGPSAWTFLMYIAMAYPDNPSNGEKEYMKLFLKSMGNVLPCEKCRVNFSNHQVSLPLDDNVLRNRTNLLNWIATINNQVRINNNEAKMNLQDIIKKYISKSGISTSNVDNNTHTPYHTYIYICLFVIILMVCVVTYVLLNRSR